MKHKLLLIDDDKSYCTGFVNKSASFLFDVKLAHNLEEGIKMLSENRRFSAVILDGHCFLEPDQQGKPGSNFVYHALHSIDDAERLQGRIIPRCVNTEYPEEFSEELKGLIPVFSKSGDPGFLFRWLRNTLSGLPEIMTREQHPSIFEHSALVFNHLEEDELIALILKGSNPDLTEIPASLASIRRLLEKLTMICAETLLRKDVSDFANNAGVSVKPVFDALYAAKIIPRPILKQAHTLYSFASEYGNHIQKVQIPAYSPGVYAYNRCLFAFLEITGVCVEKIKKR